MKAEITNDRPGKIVINGNKFLLNPAACKIAIVGKTVGALLGGWYDPDIATSG